LKEDKAFWESCCNYFIHENNGKAGTKIDKIR
jgi:hypothetical protein